MDGVAQDPLTLVWAVALGVIPVLLLLVGLQLMDSYRLVSSHAVSRSLAAGALAAVLAFAANSWLLQAGVEPHAEYFSMSREAVSLLASVQFEIVLTIYAPSVPKP